ncbi:MAG TPA: lipoprotein-releasing ABC transporter ATP-binding protein LolD [Pseudomonadales bacterium]|jgi:lipoprotein-releasing system ATP-binding protein|nr:lipoprotein-releasing ABC transporter ATP-binding protein LolD [Pseudomonadales bacterium]
MSKNKMNKNDMGDALGVLECRQLVKSYRQGDQDLLVLNQIDFCVQRGERVAIVGTSGSGKSTLLNLLGGLDEAQSGEVLIAGKSWQSMQEKERAAWRNQQLGFVYQFHHLLAEFTALENASIPLLIAGKSKAEAKQQATVMLEAVGLGARLSHKPAQLSGGERQRVAIARALVNKPACVLMDEPTGNLDADNAQQVQQLLNNLNREYGLAFVLVTHDRALAAQQDRCLVLDHGHLREHA